MIVLEYGNDDWTVAGAIQSLQDAGVQILDEARIIAFKEAAYRTHLGWRGRLFGIAGHHRRFAALLLMISIALSCAVYVSFSWIGVEPGPSAAASGVLFITTTAILIRLTASLWRVPQEWSEACHVHHTTHGGADFFSFRRDCGSEMLRGEAERIARITETALPDAKTFVECLGNARALFVVVDKQRIYLFLWTRKEKNEHP